MAWEIWTEFWGGYVIGRTLVVAIIKAARRLDWLNEPGASAADELRWIP